MEKLTSLSSRCYVSLTHGGETSGILIQKNKDHQRMMVDPMFMIVKNLRLFLTAVTLTAVTPTAVIL